MGSLVAEIVERMASTSAALELTLNYCAFTFTKLGDI